jgi:hypothetical protein
MELASTIAGSHRFLPAFIARQKQRQHEFRVQTLVWGVKEGLRTFYSAFYRFVTLTVLQYTENQNQDLDSVGHMHELLIPVAEPSTASVCEPLDRWDQGFESR